ncbi:sodium/calcium exchanger NCL2-like [Vitis riparia]|uniref:sodium/calcium exchanger NCL2-like n=1 Tax=Vitis riparia TaxID=96939 RepID=UPI00155ABDFA|nr:sodium/calcium exchanger NCL2-like [Vitis riparia]
MWKTPKNRAFSILLIYLFIIVDVRGRPLGFNGYPHELVSDGIDEGEGQKSSVLVLRGMGYSSEECEQLYGFLPCSNNIFGHLFLIVVYEYLMFHGESYVASGGEQIFKILGPGVFGASVFQVLGALPESLILLASGLLNSKDTAQEYVLTAVGLLAGSTILLLTVLWGTCVIVGSSEFPGAGSGASVDSSLMQKPYRKILLMLTGNGIATDEETGYMARIMGLSIIPFIIIQITIFFQLSSGKRVVILITLIVSLIFLLLYFIYQIFQPWIQQRRLEYVKHDHLVIRILRYFQEHALGKLLTDDGAPNISVIRGLFEETDLDGDNYISPAEIKELLLGIRFRKPHLIDKEDAVLDVLGQFDIDGDGTITKDEFIAGISKWLDETKKGLHDRSYSNNSLKDLQQVLRPWILKRRNENEMKEKLMSGILRHVQNSGLGSLLKEDNTPDIAKIKSLFERIDLDGDNCISQAELKELIMSIKFGDMPLDVDEAVARIMEKLDVNGDRLIDEEEFIQGLAKWVNISSHQALQSPKPNDEIFLKAWKETDELVEQTSAGPVDKSPWAWFKAIMLLLAGILILSVLAEPLIHSVQSFSTAANISSFFIAFILVPLATNARAATSAISAASRRKERTTSLTFSEIYGGVFMNNVLGISVLLSIIYVRELTWDFSAEVLVVMIVCMVMGMFASLRSIFPVWTSIVAYLLYPLSLLLVYALDGFAKWF